MHQQEAQGQLDEIASEMRRNREQSAGHVANVIREWIKPSATEREVEKLADAISFFLM